MRKFKFRAWDGVELFEVSQVTISGGGWHVEKGRGVSLEAQTHIELMQYTGLKDKNCVEIYEGDIVSDHNGIGTIQYCEEFAAFRVVYAVPPMRGRAKWFYDYNIRGEFESIEIIGSIHENPELLEGE